MNAVICHETQYIMTLSHEDITSMTASDLAMSQLMHAINTGFQDTHRTTNDGLATFWLFRESFHVAEDVAEVILFDDRVLITLSLWEQVLQILLSAHQDVSALESRASAILCFGQA